MAQDLSAASWLKKRHNINLREENELEMVSFLLLWSMFENSILKNNNTTCNNIPQRIVKKASKIRANHKEVLQKIREFYISHKEPDYIFTKFKFGRTLGDKVKNYLTTSEPSAADERIVVVAVIYKFRCNFFHGDKNFGDVANSQIDRFKTFNRFLIACLDEENGITHTSIKNK